MRITIFTAGSRGDVQPCLVLGKGLQEAGFDVLLAAPQNFAAWIGEHGLPFHPLRGDVQEIMAGETVEAAECVKTMGRALPGLTARGLLGAGDLPLMRALVGAVVHGRPIDLPVEAFFGGRNGG